MSARQVFSLVLTSFAMPLGLHAQELPGMVLPRGRGLGISVALAF
jgi:hypothetical protein